MKISAINAQPIRPLTNTKAQSFSSDTTAKPEKETKELSKGAKGALIGLVAVAAAAGIYFLTRGKAEKPAADVLADAAAGVKNESKKATEKALETVEFKRVANEGAEMAEGTLKNKGKVSLGKDDAGVLKILEQYPSGQLKKASIIDEAGVFTVEFAKGEEAKGYKFVTQNGETLIAERLKKGAADVKIIKGEEVIAQARYSRKGNIAEATGNLTLLDSLIKKIKKYTEKIGL